MEEESSIQPKRKNWFLRHKAWSVLGGVFALFIIGSAAANPSTPPKIEKPVQIQQVQEETKSVTEKHIVPFESQQIDDATLTKGTTKVTRAGVNGERTIVYQVVTREGKEISRKETSNTISIAPVSQITSNGTKVAAAAPVSKPVTQSSNCDPNYSGCVPIASDVDCSGGSGNGPAYVSGPVTVKGSDIYRLDSDGDGIGCE